MHHVNTNIHGVTVKSPWSASTGCVDYVKRASIANFCTYSIWKRCQSAGFIPSMESAAMGTSVNINISTQRAKSRSARGMLEVSVSMVSFEPYLEWWYLRIQYWSIFFIDLGPNCRNKHVRKLICQNYLTGFCPLGLNCPNGHPRYELPVMHNDDRMDDMAPEQQQQQPPRVPFTRGDQAPPQQQQQQRRFNNNNINAGPPGGGGGNFIRRPLEEVTCFKCGQQGHYANKCPNGRANVQ